MFTFNFMQIATNANKMKSVSITVWATDLLLIIRPEF